MTRRLDWRQLLDDADAMLDHVDAGEPGRRAFLAAASRALVDATVGPLPRDRAERAERETALDRVERRIAPHGCAGCLAERP